MKQEDNEMIFDLINIFSNLKKEENKLEEKINKLDKEIKIYEQVFSEIKTDNSYDKY